MNAVLAGWAAGYAMAIATTLAVVFLLSKVDRTAWLERLVASEVPIALLGVPVSLGAVMAWTMLGLILGSLYEAGDFSTKPDALGSPSWPFTLIIGALAFLPLPPLVLFGRRFWWLWLVMAALFLGLFGWMVPLLARR